MRKDAGTGIRRFPGLIIAGLLVVTVAACGGSAAAQDKPADTATQQEIDNAIDQMVNDGLGLDGTSGSGSGSAEATPEASAAISTVEVGQEAWFAGFHVTFGTATLETKPNRRGHVTIEATFENLGDDSARLDATIQLMSAGEPAREGFEMDIPGVQGGSSAKGLFAFDVEKAFTFADAVLTLGRSGNQQAIVPLSSTAGAAVSLEPVAVTMTGTAKAGDLKLAVTGGEVRADSPWKHGQQKDGSLILTVNYSATFESGFAGGFAFTADNVSLKLPDGSTVGNLGDGQSQSNVLIQPNATEKDLLTRFEISDPAAGTYALIVREGDETKEIPFTIS